jgi:hypothetical protein
MSIFTQAEIAYLNSQILCRLATVGPNGGPHVVPVGFRYNPELDTIDIGGHDFAKRKKFRDVRRNAQVASSSTTSLRSTRGGYAASRSAAKPKSWRPAARKSGPASMLRCSASLRGESPPGGSKETAPLSTPDRSGSRSGRAV